MAPEHKPDLKKAEDRQAAADTAKALKQEFSEIKSEEHAAAYLKDLEMCEERAEGELPKHHRKPAEQAKAIEEAAQRDRPSVVEEMAHQIATDDDEAQPVIDHAIAAVGEGRNEAASSNRGKRFLRDALVKRLHPLEAADTWLFAQVNSLSHPAWSDRILSRLSWLFTGGHGWLLVLLLLSFAGRQRAWQAGRDVMPSVWVATFLVEGPIKRFFRRRRPFVSIVRAIVVGRKPGSYSFPSGHSAAAFSGAALLSRKYPRFSAAFILLAGLIGFSRIFLGAHYPGDVLSGGLAGVSLATFFQKILRRISSRRSR